MNVLYDGKVIGKITTNHSMTVWEALALIGIDPNEMEDENTPRYDSGLFDMDYDELSEAAATLGRKGGQATSERKAQTSRENGRKGGRPRKDNLWYNTLTGVAQKGEHRENGR
jgi:general stress protein YciG